MSFLWDIHRRGRRPRRSVYEIGVNRGSGVNRGQTLFFYPLLLLLLETGRQPHRPNLAGGRDNLYSRPESEE